MRISDWSSDVCSSDLNHEDVVERQALLDYIAGQEAQACVRPELMPDPGAEKQRGDDIDEAGAQTVPHAHGAIAAMQDAEIEREQAEHDREEQQPRPARRAADAVQQKQIEELHIGSASCRENGGKNG